MVFVMEVACLVVASSVASVRFCEVRAIYLIRVTDDIKKMVGREGFEPSTNGLKVHCSTN